MDSWTHEAQRSLARAVACCLDARQLECVVEPGAHQAAQCSVFSSTALGCLAALSPPGVPFAAARPATALLAAKAAHGCGAMLRCVDDRLKVAAAALATEAAAAVGASADSATPATTALQAWAMQQARFVRLRRTAAAANRLWRTLAQAVAAATDAMASDAQRAADSDADDDNAEGVEPQRQRSRLAWAPTIAEASAEAGAALAKRSRADHFDFRRHLNATADDGDDGESDGVEDALAVADTKMSLVSVSAAEAVARCWRRDDDDEQEERRRERHAVAPLHATAALTRDASFSSALRWIDQFVAEARERLGLSPT